MKKRTLILALFLLPTLAVLAQKNRAANVRAEIDDEKVTFIFDVLPDGQYRYFNMCLRSSNPSISLTSTSGSIGKNRPAGNDLKIFWYYVNDGYTQSDIAGLKIDVIAVNPLEKSSGGAAAAGPVIKPAPIYAGLGGAVALGGGLLVAGLTKEGDAQDIYDVYKSVTDPSDPVYQDLSRDEHYQEANSKHKSAQVLTYGGAAVVAAAGYMLINRIVWMKRIRARSGGSVEAADLQCYQPPRLLLQPVATAGGVGLGLSYRF